MNSKFRIRNIFVIYVFLGSFDEGRERRWCLGKILLDFNLKYHVGNECFQFISNCVSVYIKGFRL